MKHTTAQPSLRAVAILLVITSVAAADEAPEWSAGIASVKITPSKPVPLAGYAARVKPFESVDQDIYAKALALKDAQGNSALLLTIDLCVIPRDVGQKVRNTIAARTHLKNSAILL